MTASSGLSDDRRISELLAEFRAALPPGRVTLADTMAALGDRTIGGILLVLAIPTVMPVPLGVSVLFNLPVLLFTFQMMRGGGGGNVALPDWLLRRSLTSEAAAGMIDGILPRLRTIERMLSPRLHRLTTAGFERWLGIICFGMAAIAITPLPLIGWLPGFGLIVIALGLIEHDGLAVAVGLGFAAAAVIFAVGLVVSLSYAETLWHMLPVPLL